MTTRVTINLTIRVTIRVGTLLERFPEKVTTSSKPLTTRVTTRFGEQRVLVSYRVTTRFGEPRVLWLPG